MARRRGEDLVQVVSLAWTGTYESVRKPEAATPQMRRFHEFKSSSYLSWRRSYDGDMTG